METDSSIKDYLRIIFNHKAVIIIAMIVVMATVFINQELSTPTYIAQVKMIQAAVWDEKLENMRPQWTRTTAEIEWIKSPYVVKRVVTALKLDKRPLDYEKGYASELKALLIEHEVKKEKAELEEMSPEQRQVFLFNEAVSDLMNNISTGASVETNVFSVSVTDFNPVMATRIVNSLSRSYLMFDIEKQIELTRLKYGDKHTSIIQLQEYLKMLKDTLQGQLIPDMDAIGSGSIKIMAQAQGAGLVATTNKTLRLLIAFFVSIVLGVMIAFLIEYVDQSFKLPDEIERFLNIPCLGSIPRKNTKEKLFVGNSNPSHTKYVQSYQNLSDELNLLMNDLNIKTILITDAEEAEGTAAVVANLGFCSSLKAGYRVLIIDANLRRPYMCGLFNMSNDVGLADILQHKIEFDEGICSIDTNLDFLPAGKADINPIALLDSVLMREVLNKVKDVYDMVIIYCADLRKFTDSVALSSKTDATILVINEGKVSRHVLGKVIRPLKEKKVHIMGAILNNRTYIIPEVIYKLT